jgi:hypothetical protein
MPLYLVKLVGNTLANFRLPELHACLELLLGTDPTHAYDRCVCWSFG